MSLIIKDIVLKIIVIKDAITFWQIIETCFAFTFRSVLRDDYMMGAKMKDWDKEGDSD